jgi:uncharacterized DUF497 family protein
MMLRMKFGWDDAKHERNVRERGFGFDVAAEIFRGDRIEWVDERRAERSGSGPSD